MEWSLSFYLQKAISSAEANISKKRAKQAELGWHVFLRSKGAAFLCCEKIYAKNVSRWLIKRMLGTIISLLDEAEMLQGHANTTIKNK